MYIENGGSNYKGWNHLQHTRIAVAIVRGNFWPKNKRKLAREKATAIRVRCK